MVTVRATARVTGPAVALGEPEDHETIEGPTVLRLAEATLAVPEGWSGETDDDGTVVLHRSR